MDLTYSQQDMDDIAINVEQGKDDVRQAKKLYDLFIAYSSNDEEDVRKLCHEMEDKMKLKCMIASRDFPPGALVLENCTLRMQESEKVLLIITPSFLESPYCTLEAYQALMASSLGQRGKVIPVLFKPVEVEIPDYLSMYTYIDAEKVDDLPFKLFEAFHHPVIIDRVQRKIRKERPLTREEIVEQLGASLLEVSSRKLTEGCRGISDYFPPLDEDKIIDEVREYYERLRHRLNSSAILPLKRLLFSSSKRRLLICSTILIGILFIVLITRIFIVIDHKYELKDGEIAAVVLLCLVFPALAICSPIVLSYYGNKRLREISDEIWRESMNNIKKNRFLVILNENSSFGYGFKLHIVRYDITACKLALFMLEVVTWLSQFSLISYSFVEKKYIFELLKTTCPNKGDENQQAEAEGMVKRQLNLSKYALISKFSPEVTENRHNSWLNRPCACEKIAKYWRN